MNGAVLASAPLDLQPIRQKDVRAKQRAIGRMFACFEFI